MPSKRQVYLLFSLSLGVLFFDLLYDIMEISFQDVFAAGVRNEIVEMESSLFSRFSLEAVFILAGAWAGFGAGKSWWRMIYVEDRRKKRYKPDW